MSDAFQGELRFLGIISSPAFVREPQGNGVAERFVKTLKEQLLWVQHFESVEQLRLALLAFKDRYNHGWLMQRHGYRSPAAVRAELVLGGRLMSQNLRLAGCPRNRDPFRGRAASARFEGATPTWSAPQAASQPRRSGP